MSIKCEDYFKKLERERIVRRRFPDGNSLLYLNERVHNPDWANTTTKNMLYTLDVPDRDLHLFIKRYALSGEYLQDAFTYEILFSRFFNALGVNALNSYPIALQTTVDSNCYDNVAIASENWSKVQGLDVNVIMAQREFYEFLKDNRNIISNMLKNRENFCQSSEDGEDKSSLLDNYIKNSILEIICMMLDNHLNNKRLVALSGGKYEDILSFDFEDTGLDLFRNSDDYENFECSLQYATEIFAGATPLDNTSATYMDYLKSIKKMYLDGRLPQSSVELIKKLTTINTDEVIRQAEKTTGFQFPTTRKTFFKKLMDVNQEYFSHL